MVKVIFEASVQHTGTSFLQMLLGYIWPSHILLQLGCFYKRGSSAVYGNDGSVIETKCEYELLGAIRRQIRKGCYPLHSDRTIALIHAHFGKPLKSFLSNQQIRFLVDRFKVVIPVRDPLAAIVSHRARVGKMARNNDHYRYQVNGFLFMDRLRKETDNVFFFPLEKYLKVPEVNRFEVLLDLLVFLDIDKPDWNHLAEYVKHPPLIGSIESFMETHRRNEHLVKQARYLKECYSDRNWRAIRKKIPIGTSYLTEKESILRPFMESLGYENLMWWS